MSFYFNCTQCEKDLESVKSCNHSFYDKKKNIYKNNDMEIAYKFKEKEQILISNLYPITKIPNIFLRLNSNPSIHIVDFLKEKNFPNLNFNILFQDISLNPYNLIPEIGFKFIINYAMENNFKNLYLSSQNKYLHIMANLCKKQNLTLYSDKLLLKDEKLNNLINNFNIKTISEQEYYDFNSKDENFLFFIDNYFTTIFCEGLKSIIFNLYLNHKKLFPHKIYITANNGLLAFSISKAIYELFYFKLIDVMPILKIIQSEDNDNIVRNFYNKVFVQEKASFTIKELNNVSPNYFSLLKKYYKLTSAKSILVKDSHINFSNKILKNSYNINNIFSSAAFSGLLTDWHNNEIKDSDKVLFF